MKQVDSLRMKLVGVGEGDIKHRRPMEHGAPPWLILTRLAPPEIRGVIVRDRLVAACTNVEVAGCTLLLLAPGGYGKTTLLAQVHQALLAQKRDAIWLTLSTQENTPHRFLHCLSYAIARVRPQLAVPVAASTADPVECVAALLNALAESEPIHLIVDDIDTIHAPEVAALLDRMVEDLPSNITLCLSGRRYGGSRFKKLMAAGKVAALGPNELRLDAPELERMFHSRGEPHARRAGELTQGWPLPCRLMSDNTLKNPVLDVERAFDVVRPAIGEWFDEQVLARASPGELEFLLDSGVLAQFTLEILEQVPGRRYGWADVQAASHAGFFLAPIESQRGWFGFLPLFSQHLAERLSRSDPARLAHLHRFAAEWFAKREQPVDAIRHAAETGDPLFAAEVTEKLGAITLGFDKGAWILAYSRDVPSRSTDEFPRVALGQVYLSLEEGRFGEARAAFERLKHSPSLNRVLVCDDPSTSQVGTLALLVEEVLRIYEDEPLTHHEVDSIARCLQTWRHGPPVLAASVAAALSTMQVNLHQFEDAAATADIGRRLLQGTSVSQASFILSLMGALSALALGHLREAVLQIECAQQIATSISEPHDKQVKYAELVRAQLHYEANDLEAAWAILKGVTARPEMLMNAWFELQAGVIDAAAALAATFEGPEAVRAVMHEARRIARARGLARLAQWSDVLLLRELTRAGRHREAFTMLESPGLQALLAHAPEPAHRMHLRVQTEALLVATQLMVSLERYREAEDYLLRIDPEFIQSGDVRMQITCGIARMTTAFHLRRHAQASAHFIAALTMGIETGMTRRLLDHRGQLLEVGEWMRRVGRAVPAKACAFLAFLQGAPSAHQVRPAALYRRISPRAEQVQTGACLTPREMEVLALLADGLSSKEIAAALAISEGTVKTHRKKINTKLKVGTRSRAVAVARKMLLV